jgi:hypothetical protein
MNPLCLLTKGRTFKDMTDRSGGYKVLGASGLPKYSNSKGGPTRRWHTSEPAVQSAQPNLFDAPARPAQEVIKESNKEAAMPIQEAKAMKAEAPAKGPIKASPFSADAKTAAPTAAKDPGPVRKATGFCRKLWHQFIYGRNPGPFRSPSVQPELALEKVTVLKNNLSEDDLEVVLVERKVGTGEKPLARVSKMEMTGEAWLRLTAPFRKRHSESAPNPKMGKAASPELSARA